MAANYKFNPETLYEKTNKGLDIIFKYCPDAVGCEQNRRAFKLRKDEDTASAHLSEKKDCWVVVDFGDKGYNPIEICRLFTGLSFLEALKFLYAQFNIGDTAGFIRSEMKISETTKELGWFEIIEEKKHKHLDLVGRFLTEETAKEYDFVSVKQYSFVTKKKDSNERQLCTITATEHYPIFAYRPQKEWAKIYQPMDRKWKHSFVGKKPARHVFGLERLQKKYDDAIADFNSRIKKAKGEAEKIKLTDQRDSYKLDSVTGCSGGSDALGVASLGYNVIWYNSEGEQLNYEEYKLLQRIVHVIYNLPDIDAPGVKYAYKLAENFWNLPTIWLPESIKKTGGKDFRDWLKRYSQSDLSAVKYHFANLISGALKMKFFEARYTAKGNFTGYRLRPEYLFYFLNIKGIYTYKIEQKNLDNTAPELIIFIKIEGNVVTKISPRQIREFAKQFLREKGQSVEVLELISMSTVFNENNLVGLRQIELDFKNHTADSQFFFFKNNVVQVKADKIEFEPHGKYKNFVWAQSVKPHNILEEKPFFEVEQNAEGKPSIKILRNDSPYLNYLINASRVFWRKELELPFGSNLQAKADYHAKNRFRIDGDNLTPEEIEIQRQHLGNKLYALGYLMHRYKQMSFAKIIAVTDDKPKELDDDANGGTGKTIMFKGCDCLLPNRHVLDGKNTNFQHDKHILQGLTKENDYVLIDDAHPYFPVDFLYNWTTGSFIVNPKNNAPYEIPFEEACKIVLISNYGIRNFTDSTRRRIMFVATSDYYHVHSDHYNEERKVSDDFDGKDLFHDWDAPTMNAHYNLLLQCCQLYLQYRGNEIKAPANNIVANNTKASLGDTFITWGDGYFTTDYELTDTPVPETIEGTLNRYILRKEMYRNYQETAGKSAKGATAFKKALNDYCKMKSWVLNPKDLLGSDGTIKRPVIETGKRQVLEHFFIRTPEAKSEPAVNDQESIAFQPQINFESTAINTDVDI